MVKSNIKREFCCDIELLWNIVTDNTNYKWRSDLKKIESSYVMTNKRISTDKT